MCDDVLCVLTACLLVQREIVLGASCDIGSILACAYGGCGCSEDASGRCDAMPRVIVAAVCVFCVVCSVSCTSIPCARRCHRVWAVACPWQRRGAEVEM